MKFLVTDKIMGARFHIPFTDKRWEMFICFADKFQFHLSSTEFPINENGISFLKFWELSLGWFKMRLSVEVKGE